MSVRPGVKDRCHGLGNGALISRARKPAGKTTLRSAVGYQVSAVSFQRRGSSTQGSAESIVPGLRHGGHPSGANSYTTHGSY